MTKLAVLGAGSWGTALSIALAGRFASVRLWARYAGSAREMEERRENSRYLPGFPLPATVSVASALPAALDDADIVLVAAPSQQVRQILACAACHVPRAALVVSATKGFEEETLCRMSQTIRETLRPSPDRPVTVLSGPTFAREIAAGEPAAVVLACEDLGLAETIQQAFATATLRFYTSTDVVGVETGAALKNVIAIGAGVCRGLGLGSNSVAALVTRGLAEISRLAVALGAQPRTLSGLAGLGDLVLTATGDLSRNRQVGVQLGQGRRLPEILRSMTQVAEGVATCRAAYRLGQRHGVELPIVNKMYEVLYAEKDPRRAIRELMERPLGSE